MDSKLTEDNPSRARTYAQEKAQSGMREEGKGGGKGCLACLKNTRFRPPLDPFDCLSVTFKSFHAAPRLP